MLYQLSYLGALVRLAKGRPPRKVGALYEDRPGLSSRFLHYRKRRTWERGGGSVADVAGQMAMDVLRVAATLQFALAGQFSSVAERNRRRWMSWPGAAGARQAEKTNWRGLVIRRLCIGCQPTIVALP